MSENGIAGGPARNEDQVRDLQSQKFAAWSKLRAARAEMKAIDVKMISAGATSAELEHLCW